MVYWVSYFDINFLIKLSRGRQGWMNYKIYHIAVIPLCIAGLHNLFKITITIIVLRSHTKWVWIGKVCQEWHTLYQELSSFNSFSLNVESNVSK